LILGWRIGTASLDARNRSEEASGNLVITVELPGIKAEDVKVEVTDEAITIQGERKQEKKEEKEGVYRTERSYGQFYGQSRCRMARSRIRSNAEMNNGILEIKVPVPETRPKSRQIPVSGSGATKEQEKKTTAA
jgi:HSP20 family protein